MSQDKQQVGSSKNYSGIEPAPSTEPDVVVNHDFNDGTSELTVTIVDAVSDALNVSPTELVPRVSENVDPDALDRIFRPGPDGDQRVGLLIFGLHGCRVEVAGDGTVSVYSLE